MADEFYEVHCTCCGEICTADTMAVDLDNICKIYLEKMAVTAENSFYREAKSFFEDIKVGMYLSKYQIVMKNLLKDNTRLCLTGKNIMELMQERYGIEFPAHREEAEEEEIEMPLPDDLFGDIFGEKAADTEKQPQKNNSKAKEEEDLRKYLKAKEEEDLRKLSDKLLPQIHLQREKDVKIEDKRRRVKEFLIFLMQHRQEVFLECDCKFTVEQDENGKEFLNSLTVTFLDKESKVYNRMVCPHCGHTFLRDAGKYKEHVVVMLGSARVGKTAYLAALVEKLKPEYGKAPFSEIVLQDGAEEAFHDFKESILKPYREGRKIEKTAVSKEDSSLFSLKVEIGAGEGAIGETQAEKKTMILTLVDLPGEIFLGTDDAGKRGEADTDFIINQKKICCYADAFWLCIAPQQIDRALLSVKADMAQQDKVEDDIDAVLENVSEMVKLMKSTGKGDVPLAVIITQSDLIAPEKKMFWNPEPELLQKCLMPGKRFDTNIFSYCTRDVKTYLESSNVKDIVGKIRSSFPKCNYFSVAAYGVPITGEEKVQKAPYGIALPFLWTEAALGYLIPTAMIKKYPKKKLFQKEAGEPVTIFENAEEKLYAE
jgi:hypothetical protein